MFIDCGPPKCKAREERRSYRAVQSFILRLVACGL